MAQSLVGEGWLLWQIVEPILVTFDQMQNFRTYLDKYFKVHQPYKNSKGDKTIYRQEKHKIRIR